jgi:hypothetical protein
VGLVVRLLLLLAGMLSAHRPRQRAAAGYFADDRYGLNDTAVLVASAAGPPGGGATSWPDADSRPRSPVTWPERAAGAAPEPPGPQQPGEPGQPGPGGPPRRRIPARVKWAAVVVVAVLIFRRIVAWALLTALSATLHLVGVDVRLPHVTFGLPWQTITTGRTTTTNTDLGPWVLQKIQGISKPALGRETFTFYFTHKVSKNIGPWPCWYASTFYAVGYASATVNLNPGPAWWAPSAGHYQLQVLSRPAAGKPGQVAVTMVLPPPQLPQSVHDVSIDNLPSKPIASQHSWTYPGFGCGVVLRPQFSPSVLYAQAQQIAFYRATRVDQVTAPLITAAENQATQTIRDNFIQPTVNAFGYTLDQFTLRWAATP